MKLISLVSAIFVAVAAWPSAAWAAEPLQRFALIVGANAGGGDRPELRYAVADAERFARVLDELGGVSPGNAILLRQPKLRDLGDGLDLLSRRVVEARRAGGAQGGRIEIVVYYSGHADEKGLLLGDDRYSYQTLRDRLDQIPADVRIAVLDACSSGAFTRLKGGKVRRPFLIDESASMRGHAFLTSSAETEAAQESDRIRASYFTHYLVSGFRGAADLSGDGKVTLNEAYRFAFDETLGRTEKTRGGAQHPSYDIKLSGTGDVVMTDVRQTTATLVLGEELDGRFFVRTAAQELVVELYKPRGRRVELAVEPGVYDVRVERDKGSFTAKATVTDGGRVELLASQFGVAAAEPTQARGGETFRFGVAGRSRIDLLTTAWTGGYINDLGAATLDRDRASVTISLQYTYFLHEKVALTGYTQGFGRWTGLTLGLGRVGTGSVRAPMLGVRFNPMKGDTRLRALKPYLAFGIGPAIGSSTESFVGPAGNLVFTESRDQVTVATQAGAGINWHVARNYSLGLGVNYNWLRKFSEQIGPHDDFGGPQFVFTFGRLFGKGR